MKEHGVSAAPWHESATQRTEENLLVPIPPSAVSDGELRQGPTSHLYNPEGNDNLQRSRPRRLWSASSSGEKVKGQQDYQHFKESEISAP